MIKKPNRMSLVEQVAEQMEDLIGAGHWTIGEKIPAEMHLMEQFGVSRNTLREAIRALVHAGLLEAKQGSGTIVKASNTLGVALERHVQKAKLLEVLDVRFALEKQAAKLAAERRETDDIDNLKATLIASQEAAAVNNIEAFIQADLLFHKQIVHAAGNQLLIDLYEPLSDVVYTFVEQMIAIEAHLLVDDASHMELVQAIKQGDVNGAGNIVERHFTQLSDYVKNRIE